MLANIPFQFVAGDQTLLAGEYRIERVFSGSLGPLRIRSTDDHALTTVMTMTVSANDWQESKLIFNRYGNHYFLSQIWTQGDNSGRELFKSQRESELARKEAKREVRFWPTALLPSCDGHCNVAAFHCRKTVNGLCKSFASGAEIFVACLAAVVQYRQSDRN